MAAPTFRNMREFRMFYRAPMQPVLILELLILLALANGTPWLASGCSGEDWGSLSMAGPCFAMGP